MQDLAGLCKWPPHVNGTLFQEAGPQVAPNWEAQFPLRPMRDEMLFVK